MLYYFEILVEVLKLIVESLLDDYWGLEISFLKGYKFYFLYNRIFVVFSVKVVIKLYLYELEVIFNKIRYFF